MAADVPPADRGEPSTPDLRRLYEEDVTGLAFACIVAGDGSHRPALRRLDLAGLDAALAAGEPGGVVWAHLNAGVARARDWIAARAHIPEPARDLLLEDDTETRIDRIGDGVVGSLADLHGGVDAEPFALVPLRFYLDRRCLITVRRRPARAAYRLRRDLEGGRLEVETGADLALALLDAVSADLEGGLSRLARELDRAEDRIVAGEAGPGARGALREGRRVILRWRGQTLFRRHAVQRVAARLPAWLEDPARFELRGAIERLESLADELRILDDRAIMLEGEIAGRLAEETNRNLYVLSILTAVFLPMTLVTGVFGMNVAGLPGTQDPAAFWWVALGMAASALLLLGLLRLRQLF